MSCFQRYIFLLSLLLQSILLINHTAMCDGTNNEIISNIGTYYGIVIDFGISLPNNEEVIRCPSVKLERALSAPDAYKDGRGYFDEEANLFQGINNYRATLNLTALTKNKKAECLAGEIADQFKSQPCTNTTGSNTVLGTEPQFSNYPKLLDKCDLNVTTTRDGTIMPACVPNLAPNLVLTNFTQSQYSGYLNDTKFTGAGIGSDGNWIVVVLTTSTPEGNYVEGDNSVNYASKLGLVYHYLFLLMGLLVLF